MKVHFIILRRYIDKFVDIIIKRSSFFIWLWERFYLKKYGEEPLKHQPIFIIGAPRTGSTILYQAITNIYDVLYINNLSCRLHRNLFFGFWLSKKIFKNKPHNNYQSDHGNTMQYGLNAPSECGVFWYRWLPKDHHYIDYDDINNDIVKKIRTELTAIINYYDKPLVINNNNAGLRIKLLKKVFPDAFWIVCYREPIYVAQSLLNARYKYFGNYNSWWSMLPQNHEYIKTKNPVIQPVLQLYYINKHIKEDLKSLYDKKNYVWLKYEEIMDNPELVCQVCNSFNITSKRSNPLMPSLKKSNKINLEDKTISIIENEVKKWDWDDYKS